MNFVYILGENIDSQTSEKVIVTIKPYEEYIKYKNYTSIINPYYRSILINVGKIVKITDLNEDVEFDSCSYNNCTLTVGKYFNTFDDYIKVYQYKLAILEKSHYVPNDFSGLRFRHYSNGHIFCKLYYNKGTLITKFLYRNDTYNTLHTVLQYNNGYLASKFKYDSREALIKQTWYDTKGKIFHDLSKTPDPNLSDITSESD